MVNLLFNHVLVRRVIRVQHLDRLPTAHTCRPILALERQTRNHDGERQSLGINTGLHKLLLAREVRVAADEAKGRSHRRHPGAEDETVAVFARPVFGSLHRGLLRLDLVAQRLLLVVV